VVVGPRVAETTVRSAQLVRLSSTAVTVVVVFANGSVDNEVIEIDEDVSDAALAAASVHLTRNLVDRALARTEVPDSGDAGTDAICRLALDTLRSHPVGDDPAFVGGVSTMAEAFDAVDVVRQVLHTLEQQFVVVSLVRDIVDRGMSVAIGVEHGVEPLSACSVVVAPVVVDGEHVGSVGVLGPTRMNYPQALATVDIVSDRLGRRLGDG
jgi:heat-inducible transcriptional repressor